LTACRGEQDERTTAFDKRACIAFVAPPERCDLSPHLKEPSMRQSLAAVAVIAAAAVAGVTAAQSPAISPELKAAVANPARTPENVARDKYRHPAETLAFFGVKPTDTVVEFSPGGGWYTEILMPYVKGKGRYVALVGQSGVERTKTALDAKFGAQGPVTVVGMDATAGTSGLPAGGADVLLTFRNVHNLTMGPNPAVGPNAFKVFFAALKPGGTLGIVEHRLPETADAAREKTSGYLKTSTVRKLAEDAGFVFDGASEVNANPKDTTDHPEGVWTLPPVLRLKDVDREKYLAIGESDRMTLRFKKPR
jgi:predicted methyltransferase